MPRLGLGVYPDSPCYDPDRPSWMPYWLDTFGENACKWGFYPGADHGVIPNPPAPVLAAPPNPSGAGWTPEQVATATHTRWIDSVLETIRKAEEEGTYRPGGPDPAVSPVQWVYLGLAGVALLVAWPYLTKGGRRRR